MVLVDELKHVSLLEQFAVANLRRIASIAHLQEYEADDVIFWERQNARQLYIVLDGEVSLEIGVPDVGSVQVLKVGPGKLLGWSSVLGCGPMKATARALTVCRLAALDAGQVLQLVEADPKFGVEFFRCLS